MYYNRRHIVLAAAAALLCGVLLHGIYRWFPGPMTALIGPIRESIWEHVKIVFWPLLGASVLLTRGRPGAVRPWLAFTLLSCLLLVVLGWAWNILLGGEAAWVNAAIFTAVILLPFALAPGCDGPFDSVRWKLPPVLTVLLALLLILFSLKPPAGVLFTDLSIVGAWYGLPC